MAKILNAKWMEEMRPKIWNGGTIDVTTSLNIAIQWLIERLTESGRAFKLYNLGAGVKRVTTDTDTCPCCRRKLEG